MVKTGRRWQGYTYGRLVFISTCNFLVDQLIEVIRSPQVSVAGLYGIAACIIWPGIFLVAVAKGGPWAWHVTLAFTASCVATVVGKLAYWGIYGQPPLSWMRDHGLFAWLFVSVCLLLVILNFCYFYRRRTMFGAVSHYGWLERRIPSLVVAQTYRQRIYDNRALISGWPLVLSIGAGFALNALSRLLDLLP